MKGFNRVNISFRVSGGQRLCGMTYAIVWFYFVTEIRKTKSPSAQSHSQSQDPILCQWRKKGPAKIRWHTNLRHTPFSLCFSSLKQGVMGLAGNKGWLSINVHTHTHTHTVKGFRQKHTLITRHTNTNGPAESLTRYVDTSVEVAFSSPEM